MLLWRVRTCAVPLAIGLQLDCTRNDLLQLKDDAHSSSFTFVCTEDAGGLSSLQLTFLLARTIMAIVVKAKNEGVRKISSEGDPCSRSAAENMIPDKSQALLMRYPLSSHTL